MVLFRRARPIEVPPNSPGADERPMQPFLPELPEDDLLVDERTWQASQGWHGEQAQQAAETAIRDAHAHAFGVQTRITNELMLAQRVSQADAAPCCCCGRAVERDEARMDMGSPWRWCPDCWAQFYREPETGRRRLAFTRALIDLPDDIVPADLDGTVFRYYSELPDTHPTGEGVEAWSWLRLDTLRDQVLDNHRVRFLVHRAPGEFAGRFCGGCGILISLGWSAETVPVLRPGSESEPRLPVCADCAQTLIASGGDARDEAFDDFLFWRALGLDPGRVESGWAAAHGFVSYARRYCDADPELHDFRRPFGWVEQADLAAVRDRLLTKIPERTRDRETQQRYRRKQTMKFLRDHQQAEPVPVPQFSVSPTVPAEQRSGWHE